MGYYNPAEPIERSILILLNGKHYVLKGEPSVSRWTVNGSTPTGVHIEVPLTNVDVIEKYTEFRLGSFRDRLSELENQELSRKLLEKR